MLEVQQEKGLQEGAKAAHSFPMATKSEVPRSQGGGTHRISYKTMKKKGGIL